MPSLTGKSKTFIKAALSAGLNRPHLTWAHAREGYVYGSDGYRAHIVQAEGYGEGTIEFPKSLPYDGGNVGWDFIKSYLASEGHTCTISAAGILREQVATVLKRASSSRHLWYMTALVLDHHVLSLVPHYRGVFGFARLDWRDEAIGLTTPYVDLRYLKGALHPFDDDAPVQVTFPRERKDPLKLQQGLYTALIATME
jgi:hypothetical protein